MKRLVPLLILAASICLSPSASGRTVHYNVSVTVIGPGYVGGCGDGGCIKCPFICSMLIRQGTSITLDPQPYTGAVFGGWGGDCSGTDSCTVVSYSDTPGKNISASFSEAPPPPPPTFQLTVGKQGSGTGFVGGGGIQCGPTCSVSEGSGANVQLIAVADPSSRFTGWGGACTGTDPCALTMTAAMSVTVTFELLRPPKVTALASSGVRGKTAKLRYRVTTDAADAHREVVTILLRHRLLARLAKAPAGGPVFFVSWRVPATLRAGELKFCVLTTGTVSKKAAVSCAPLRIT